MSKIQNDWIATTINNPNVTANQLVSEGINASNTQLQSKDYYKQSPLIQQKFTENGKFNDAAFDTFYANAASKYNQFKGASKVDLLKYDVLDPRAVGAAQVKDPGLSFSQAETSDQVQLGSALSFDSTTYSIREQAKINRFYDQDLNRWTASAYKDIFTIQSGTIGSWLRQLTDPNVLAKYDEDTEEVSSHTGEVIQHRKGEVKRDLWGNPYIERKKGEGEHSDEIVSLWDTMTDLTTTSGQLDPFRGDMKEKGFAKTVIKNAAIVGAALFVPYLGPALVYAQLATMTAKALPVIPGLFDTNIPFLDKLANMGKAATGSKSDVGKSSFFNAEAMTDLVSDVMLQWEQQLLMANNAKNIALFFKGSKSTNGAAALLKGANKEAEALYLAEKAASEAKVANGLMSQEKFAQMFTETGGLWNTSAKGALLLEKTTARAEETINFAAKLGQKAALFGTLFQYNGELYENLKGQGLTNMEAALVTMGATFAMFGVDSMGLGEIFYDPIKGGLRQRAQGTLLDAASHWGQVVRTDIGETAAERGLSLIGQGSALQKLGLKDLKNWMKNLNKAGILGKAVGEGLEEFGEEVVTDFTKQIYNWVAAAQGKEKRTDAFNDAGARYLQSFFGGFIGGGLFAVKDGLKKKWNKTSLEEDVQSSLVSLVANNETKTLLNELDKLHKDGQLGSTTDSVAYVEGAKGDKVFLTVSDGNTQSQNDFIYKALKDTIIGMDSILKEANVQDESHQVSLNAIRNLKIFGLEHKASSDLIADQFIKDYNEKANRLLNLTATYNEAAKTIDGIYYENEEERKAHQILDEEIRGLSPDQKEKREANLKRIQDQIDQVKKDIADYNEGKYSRQYLAKLIFSLDSALHEDTAPLFFDSWLKEFHNGVTPEELTDKELQAYTQKYSEYRRSTLEKALDNSFENFLRNYDSVQDYLKTLKDADFSALSTEVSQELNKKLYHFDRLIDFNEEGWEPETLESESYVNRNKPEWKDKRKALIEAKNNEILTQFVNDNLENSEDPSWMLAMMPSFLHQNISLNNNDLANSLISHIYENAFDKEDVQKIIQEYGISGEDFKSLVSSYVNDRINGGDTFTEVATLLSENVKTPMTVIVNAFNNIKSKVQNGIEAPLIFDPTRHSFDSIDTEDPTVNPEIVRIVGDLANNYDLFGQARYINFLKDDAVDRLNDNPNYVITVDDINLDFFNSDRIAEAFSLATGEDLPIGDKPAFDNISNVKEFVENNLGILQQIVRDSAIAEKMHYYNPITDSKEALETFKKFKETLDGIFTDPKNGYDFITKVLQYESKLDLNLSKLALLTSSKLLPRELSGLHTTLKEILQLKASEESGSDFTLDDNYKQKLEDAQGFLTILRQQLLAARSTGDDVYSLSLNEQLNQVDDVQGETMPRRVVIDQSKTDRILREINNLQLFIGVKDPKTKIYNSGSLFALSDANAIQKQQLFIKSDLALTATIHGLFKNGLSTNAFKFEHEGKVFDLLEGVDSIGPLSPDNVQADVQVNALMDTFYENVQKYHNQGISYETIFKNLFETFASPEKAIRQLNSNLNPQLNADNLTPYSRIMMITTIASIKSTEFYSYLRERVKEEVNIAPLTVQEYVSRMGIGYVNNPELFRTALNYISKGDPNVAVMNALFIQGSGGTGKTSVVARNIANFVKGEVWLAASQDTQVQNLYNSIGKGEQFVIHSNSDGIKSLYERMGLNVKNLQDARESILSGKAQTDQELAKHTNIKKTKEDRSIIVTDFNHFGVKKLNSNTPEVLMIDEATLLTSVESQVLAHWCDVNGTKLILVGDRKQNGAPGIGANIRHENNLLIRTPSMDLTLRDANVLHSENQRILGTFIDRLIDADGSDPAKFREQFLSTVNDLSRLDFSWSDSEGQLTGDLITSELTDDQLKLISGTVGYVGSTESETYTKLKSLGLEVTVLTELQAQSQEFDYLVADKEFTDKYDSNGHFIAQAQSLYTLITRGRKGTILVTNSIPFIHESIKKESSGNLDPIAAYTTGFRQRKLASLDAILGQEQHADDNESKKIAPEESVKQQQGSSITVKEDNNENAQAHTEPESQTSQDNDEGQSSEEQEESQNETQKEQEEKNQEEEKDEGDEPIGESNEVEEEENNLDESIKPEEAPKPEPVSQPKLEVNTVEDQEEDEDIFNVKLEPDDPIEVIPLTEEDRKDIFGVDEATIEGEEDGVLDDFDVKDTPLGAYGELTLLGLKANDDYSWDVPAEGTPKRDIMLFMDPELKPGDKITNQSVQIQMQKNLLQLKKALLNHRSWKASKKFLSTIMSQDEYENFKYFAVVRELNEGDYAIRNIKMKGQENMLITNPDTGKQYVMLLVARTTIKGNPYEVTVGALANPWPTEEQTKAAAAAFNKKMNALQGKINNADAVVQSRYVGKLKNRQKFLTKQWDLRQRAMPGYRQKATELFAEADANKGYAEVQIHNLRYPGFARVVPLGYVVRLTRIKSDRIRFYKKLIAELENGTTKRGNIDHKIQYYKQKIAKIESEIEQSFSSLNPYTLTSPMYIYTNPSTEEQLMDKKIAGQRCVIFVSDDLSLEEEKQNFKDIYINEQKRKSERVANLAEDEELVDEENQPTVRALVLNNLGLSIFDLIDPSLSDVRKFATGNKTQQFFPFDARYTGMRMYVNMWNYRAHLTLFLQAVDKVLKPALQQLIKDNRKGDDGTPNISMNPEELNDFNTLHNVLRYGISTRQKEAQQHIDDLVQEKIDLFNEYLSKDGIPQFRLEGKVKNENGFYIRQLKGEGVEAIYGKRKYTPNGIYIDIETANRQKFMMDTLFMNILDKVITCNYDPTLPLTTKEGYHNSFNKQLRAAVTGNGILEAIQNVDEEGDFSLKGKYKLTQNVHFGVGYNEQANLLGAFAHIPFLISRLYEFSNFIPTAPEENQQELIKNHQLKIIWNKGKENQGVEILVYTPIIQNLANSYQTQEKGYDETFSNLLHVMFHGTLEDVQAEGQRATDALFPKGFFVDPIASTKGDGKTQFIPATNHQRAFYGVDAGLEAAMVFFNFDSPKSKKGKQSKPKQKNPAKPEPVNTEQELNKVKTQDNPKIKVEPAINQSSNEKARSTVTNELTDEMIKTGTIDGMSYEEWMKKNPKKDVRLAFLKSNNEEEYKRITEAVGKLSNFYDIELGKYYIKKQNHRPTLLDSKGTPEQADQMKAKMAKLSKYNLSENARTIIADLMLNVYHEGNWDNEESHKNITNEINKQLFTEMQQNFYNEKSWNLGMPLNLNNEGFKSISDLIEEIPEFKSMEIKQDTENKVVHVFFFNNEGLKRKMVLALNEVNHYAEVLKDVIIDSPKHLTKDLYTQYSQSGKGLQFGEVVETEEQNSENENSSEVSVIDEEPGITQEEYDRNQRAEITNYYQQLQGLIDDVFGEGVFIFDQDLIHPESEFKLSFKKGLIAMLNERGEALGIRFNNSIAALNQAQQDLGIDDEELIDIRAKLEKPPFETCN